jgi:serine/threonine protein kinase
MEMEIELWKKIETLYQAALAKPVEQRAWYLADACPDDPQLRREVQSLLDQDDDSFLEGSPLSPATFHQQRLGTERLPYTNSPLDQPIESSSKPAAMIGPYLLQEVIGRGGMGEVWLAEQQEPVRRRVAIKLIKIGMDTREVVTRFQSERQALALMDHPAIAKVFDAGSTSEGRPYFVMEYVPGIPITDYCDEHKLTIRERLELFILVCEGVQHAHQKTIIHRDLKPSNILVAEVDGKPMPRIIDFGIAKATSGKLTVETLHTRMGAVLGTIDYMSPEQAKSEGEDIDTRTDVYSLGVVLYELLVGARPFEFRKVAFDEVLRCLREVDAPKPSTKFITRRLESETAAQNRSTDPPTLLRQLRGDPDAIVLKALEKDRARRYSSATDFAGDIGKYLRHEPVTVHPPTVAYRARKYVQRHRVGVAFVGVLAVLLVAAAVAEAVQLRRITRARDQADTETAIAQAVNDFLQNDVLAQASTATQSGSKMKIDPDLKVRTALNRAAARIAGKFERQPEVEAAIRDTIGQAYTDLGLYPEARTQLERAFDLQRRALGAANPKTLKTMSRLGGIALAQGNYPTAEALLTQTLAIQRRVLGPENPERLATMNSLATTYEREGKYAQAEPLFSRTLELRRRVLGLDHRDTLASMNDLAVTYAEEGNYLKVEALFSQILDLSGRALGLEHPDTLRAMDNLANAYASEGKYQQAEAPYSQVTEIKRGVLGPEHPETLRSMGNLAVNYEAEGMYSQAEALQSQKLEISRRVLGREHPDTLLSMSNLADIYGDEGKYGQAEALLAQTSEIERRALGPEHPNTLDTLSEFAWMYQRMGKYALAETYAAQTLARRRRVLGSDNLDSMTSAADLVLAYVSQAKFIESEPLAREALEFNRKNQPDNWQRFRAESLLGASLAGQKKYAEAEPLLLEGYQGMLARKDRIDVPNWYHLDRARAWIVKLYQAWGKPARADAF